MKTLPEDEQAAVFNLLERYLMRNYVIGNSTRNYNTQAYEMIEGKFDFEEALSKPEVADDRFLPRFETSTARVLGSYFSGSNCTGTWTPNLTCMEQS